MILDWVLSLICIFFGRPRFRASVVDSVVGSSVVIGSRIWGDFLEEERLASGMWGSLVLSEDEMRLGAVLGRRGGCGAVERVLSSWGLRREGPPGSSGPKKWSISVGCASIF